MLGTAGANSDNIHWQTPKKGNFGRSDMSLDSLKKEFNLTLDPCAPIQAKQDPSLSCCTHFFTEEEDGLVQEWKENCFVNPPFTPESKNPDNNIALWIRKGIIQSQKHGTANVFFIPAYTGANWWHDYVLPYGIIRYIRGRVRCWKNGEPDKGSPNIDFVVVVFSSPKSYPWSES